METFELNNLDNVEIANESHKTQFISTLASIGLYNDVASIIYSYKYYYTDSKVISRRTDYVNSIECFDCDGRDIIHIHTNHNVHMFYLVETSQNETQLIKLGLSVNLENLLKLHVYLFSYNNHIYILRNYILWIILIDYSN